MQNLSKSIGFINVLEVEIVEKTNGFAIPGGAKPIEIHWFYQCFGGLNRRQNKLFLHFKFAIPSGRKPSNAISSLSGFVVKTMKTTYCLRG